MFLHTRLWDGGGGWFFLFCFFISSSERARRTLFTILPYPTAWIPHMALPWVAEGSMEGNHGASACIVLAFPTQQS